MNTGHEFLAEGTRCRKCGAHFDTDKPCPEVGGYERISVIVASVVVIGILVGALT